MYVERLELHDFRNYVSCRLELGPGVTVVVGGNAQGKTNLLEALHYLSTGASHRVAHDAPLVRTGAQAAVIRAVGRIEGRRAVTVELEVRPGGANRARLGGQAQPRTRVVLGVVRSVLFAPEDLQLVRGDPVQRRRFLDDVLAQRRPAYLAARQEYERVLRQRNALLKRARRRGGPPDATLDVWTDALVRTGGVLLAARIALVHALSEPAAQHYRELLGPEARAGEEVAMGYELSTGRVVQAAPEGGVPDPVSLAEELRAGALRRAAEERERGVTLVGPHRDELLLRIGQLPAKGYASHGQSWCLALALRLASRRVLAEVGEEPVVLLDDVFAELDEHRRARLARRCDTFEQVLVTAAVANDVPLAGRHYEVVDGAVGDPAVAADERP